MLVQAISLRKIPARTLRDIVAASPQNRAPCVFVEVLVRPLPDVPGRVQHSKLTRTFRMRIHVVRPGQFMALALNRHGFVVPIVTPWVDSSVGSLSGVLPFPFMRQTFASPSRIRTGILERYPGDRLVPPTRRIGSLPPVPKEVVVVFGMVLGGIYELFEFAVCHRGFIDEEARDTHLATVITARRIFPGILHVHSDLIRAFDLNSRDLKIKLCGR